MAIKKAKETKDHLVEMNIAILIKKKKHEHHMMVIKKAIWWPGWKLSDTYDVQSL
jgi:hypothetical protein